MRQYRVTKYNPADRDASGGYLLHDGTSRSEIGKLFNDVCLTAEAYQVVEDAYVAAAEAFLQESDVGELTVTGLESPKGESPVMEGQRLAVAEVGSVLRALLREQVWCRLEGAQAFIHVGWDFDMYVGVPHECPGALAEAKARTLYVEEFRSPLPMARCRFEAQAAKAAVQRMTYAELVRPTLCLAT